MRNKTKHLLILDDQKLIRPYNARFLLGKGGGAGGAQFTVELFWSTTFTLYTGAGGSAGVGAVSSGM